MKVEVTNSAGIKTETAPSKLYYSQYTTNASQFWAQPASGADQTTLSLNLVLQETNPNWGFTFNNYYSTNLDPTILDIKAEPVLSFPHACYHKT